MQTEREIKYKDLIALSNGDYSKYNLGILEGVIENRTMSQYNSLP